MATANLMTQIMDQYAKMTKIEKKVADFVLSSPQEVLSTTITELARRCKVGETSVFRFCKTLNLKGYQDFRLSLALSTAGSEPLQKKDTISISSSQNTRDIAANVLEAYTLALKHAYANLNFDSVPRVVDWLLSSRSINLFGFGGSGTSAGEARNKFMKILPNVIHSHDSHMQLTQAALLGEEDLAIIFSNSGITKDCIEIARICHQAKTKVVFVTMFPKTPALPYCDELLLCGAIEGPLEGGSIAAKTAQLFFIDVLYAETFKKLGVHALENKKKTAQIITEKMM